MYCKLTATTNTFRAVLVGKPEPSDDVDGFRRGFWRDLAHHTELGWLAADFLCCLTAGHSAEMTADDLVGIYGL